MPHSHQPFYPNSVTARAVSGMGTQLGKGQTKTLHLECLQRQQSQYKSVNKYLSENKHILSFTQETRGYLLSWLKMMAGDNRHTPTSGISSQPSGKWHKGSHAPRVHLGFWMASTTLKPSRAPNRNVKFFEWGQKAASKFRRKKKLSLPQGSTLLSVMLHLQIYTDVRALCKSSVTLCTSSAQLELLRLPAVPGTGCMQRSCYIM